MKNLQLWILGVVLVAAVSAMLAAVYFTQGGGTKIRSEKRFTAKSGKTRKKAVALSTSKRSSSGASPQRGDGTDGNPVPIRSLSSPNDNMTPGEHTAREALNTFSAEAGIETCLEALKASGAPLSEAERVSLYLALAVLSDRLRPPDHTQAMDAFDQALAHAPSLEWRQRVVLHQAQMLGKNGHGAEALPMLNAVLAEDGDVSSERLQLELLTAQLHEAGGADGKAESAYRAMLDNAVQNAVALDKPSRDLLRLAGFRLAQIYRATNRVDEADALARRLRSELPAPS